MKTVVIVDNQTDCPDAIKPLFNECLRVETHSVEVLPFDFDSIPLPNVALVMDCFPHNDEVEKVLDYFHKKEVPVGWLTSPHSSARPTTATISFNVQDIEWPLKVMQWFKLQGIQERDLQEIFLLNERS
jgi:hypothetical protein